MRRRTVATAWNFPDREICIKRRGCPPDTAVPAEYQADITACLIASRLLGDVIRTGYEQTGELLLGQWLTDMETLGRITSQL